ncbi:hypothetical protein E2C01_033219 [Portunus trituberculatus]|uniref:Uncharacterized protein n=1 Tax=Portunus trituberculatus TaxID=210409 RepID=A0A5B7F4Z8_PORTR|nr:hypothetical protein [Portunus trituberculatus]
MFGLGEGLPQLRGPVTSLKEEPLSSTRAWMQPTMVENTHPRTYFSISEVSRLLLRSFKVPRPFQPRTQPRPDLVAA